MKGRDAGIEDLIIRNRYRRITLDRLDGRIGRRRYDMDDEPCDYYSRLIEYEVPHLPKLPVMTDLVENEAKQDAILTTASSIR